MREICREEVGNRTWHAVERTRPGVLSDVSSGSAVSWYVCNDLSNSKLPQRHCIFFLFCISSRNARGWVHVRRCVWCCGTRDRSDSDAFALGVRPPLGRGGHLQGAPLDRHLFPSGVLLVSLRVHARPVSIDHPRPRSLPKAPFSPVGALATCCLFLLHQNVQIALISSVPRPSSFSPLFVTSLTCKALPPVRMPGSKYFVLYNLSTAIAYRLPDRPPPSLPPSPPHHHSTMVAPFLLHNSVSQVSLAPSNRGLKSKVSLSALANAMRKGEFPHHSYTNLPKNYTKSYGPCTLSLNADHEACSGLPIFSNGAVISGSLEISKISKLLQSIQMMVRMPTGV